MLHDLFICHASEDKDAFVRPLAERLRNENVAVWYDEFSLSLGDSIRRALDKGLRQSRFGAVVLSEAFFRKEWPQYELDGLTQLEMRGREKVILPIWHGVTHGDVLSYSPSLAGRQAVSSSEGLDRVVSKICAALHPSGSPLLIARDEVIDWGLSPPVVTDEYWLRVVEASNRLPGFGAYVPEESTWGRWSFPLPPKDDGPNAWGERLAWSAMQLQWTHAAEELLISPLTPPAEVLAFIQSHAGLFETCQTFPVLLAEYAPQLTIPGFAGPLEDALEVSYKKSLQEATARQKADSRFGNALTTTNSTPLCGEEWSLRHPSLGNYKARTVAHAYFSGGMFGPTVSPFYDADHAFWLLSSSSQWLPEKIHEVLIAGLKKSRSWTWGYLSSDKGGEWAESGKLCEHLFDVIEGQKFKWSPQLENDLYNRVALSIDKLSLPESVDEICARFKSSKFSEGLVHAEQELRWKRKRTS